jgi:hypothetical protein
MLGSARIDEITYYIAAKVVNLVAITFPHVQTVL